MAIYLGTKTARLKLARRGSNHRTTLSLSCRPRMSTPGAVSVGFSVLAAEDANCLLVTGGRHINRHAKTGRGHKKSRTRRGVTTTSSGATTSTKTRAAGCVCTTAAHAAIEGGKACAFTTLVRPLFRKHSQDQQSKPVLNSRALPCPNPSNSDDQELNAV